MPVLLAAATVQKTVLSWDDNMLVPYVELRIVPRLAMFVRLVPLVWAFTNCDELPRSTVSTMSEPVPDVLLNPRRRSPCANVAALAENAEAEIPAMTSMLRRRLDWGCMVLVGCGFVWMQRT